MLHAMFSLARVFQISSAGVAIEPDPQSLLLDIRPGRPRSDQSGRTLPGKVTKICHRNQRRHSPSPCTPRPDEPFRPSGQLVHRPRRRHLPLRHRTRPPLHRLPTQKPRPRRRRRRLPRRHHEGNPPDLPPPPADRQNPNPRPRPASSTPSRRITCPRSWTSIRRSTVSGRGSR